MDAWLASLEQLGLIRAVKTSFFAYPLINAAHIAAVGVLLTSVVLMDLRLLGWFEDLPESRFVELLRRLALGGFIVAVMTGCCHVRRAGFRLCGEFALLDEDGVNRLGRRQLPRVLSSEAGPTSQRIKLSVAGRFSVIASLVLWPCVLIAGRFLGFV